MTLRLACSTICFRNYPVAVALREIKELGFVALDLATIPELCPHFDAVHEPAAARDALADLIDDVGLLVPTLTTNPGQFNAPEADAGDIIEHARAYLRLAARVGAKTVNLPCGQRIEDQSHFRVHAERQAAGIKEIALAASDLGIRLTIEAPHQNGLVRTLDEAHFLMERIDEDHVDFLLDVGHVHAAGFSPPEAVHAFGGKIGHVHVKDGKGQDIFRVPGEGEIDFAAFFSELQQVGYHGYCALELDGQGESVSERRQAVERALRFLESQNVELVGWER